MRQVWIPRGPPEVLQMRDVPEPQRPGEVRVAVEAIGVLRRHRQAAGHVRGAPRPPFVPGRGRRADDALGEGVDRSARPDVIGLTRFGGYSEQVCVPAEHALPRPATMTVEQGAAFLVSALTAYAGLVALGGIKRGERVLIQAAAGGVGLMAVDIARLHEATIFGTASAGKHDFLRERGVQHPIDAYDFVNRAADGRRGRAHALIASAGARGCAATGRWPLGDDW